MLRKLMPALRLNVQGQLEASLAQCLASCESRRKMSNSEQPKPDHPTTGEDAHSHIFREQLRQLRASSTTQQRTLGVPPAEKPVWKKYTDQAIAIPLLRRLGTGLADLMHNQVETDFELDEFLEGAKDAYYMVHQLMGEGDFASLKPMVSSKLLNALKLTGKDYGDSGLSWRTEIEGDVEAYLTTLELWSAEKVKDYDEELAAPGLEENRDFVVIKVAFKGCLRTIVTRIEDGHIVEDVTDWRQHLWRFITGPLPADVPVKSLETGWTLLDI